ncbi:MAG: ribosome biogenesis GTPase Der [Candidatus Methylacidiphilales bacterium]
MSTPPFARKPVVAIVGRPNVGKSALFNRLIGSQISLVYDRPGVTRDRISMDCSWHDKPYTLLDTGGIGLEDESGFEVDIEREVQVSIDLADDILFVVDGREGLTPLDRDVAKRLRGARQRIFVVVNKMDTIKQDDWEGEFHALGFPEVHAVSAAHGRGVSSLMEALTELWPVAPVTDDSSDVAEKKELNIAVVGRPNAGKSSLINALLDEERVIVSPLAGTTRDAVDVRFEHQGRKFCLVDTAGMRKRTRLADPLEQAMTSRSAHSINRADICVLVIDAEVGVAVQEKKIAGLIQKAGKPCLIVVNKWDLARDAGVFDLSAERDQLPSPEVFLARYKESVEKALFFLRYAPIVFTSALEKRRLGGWFGAVEEICHHRETILSGGRLNRALQEAMKRHAPPRQNNRSLKLYYVAQKRDMVTSPTLMAFINDKKLWSEEYERYLEQAVRSVFPLVGCPLLWALRDKQETSSPRERRPRSAAADGEPDASGQPDRPRPRSTVSKHRGKAKPDFGKAHSRPGPTKSSRPRSPSAPRRGSGGSPPSSRRGKGRSR